MKQLLLILPLLGLAACSSVSQQECQLGDWFAIGEADAQQGIAASQFSIYQKECSARGLTTDLKSYQRGHSKGAIEFCQYDNGILWGQQGKAYNALCSGALEAEFKLGYERGRNWYSAKVALENLQLVFKQNAGTISTLNQRIADNKAQLTGNLPAEQTERLSNETEALQQQLAQLHQSQQQLEKELQQAELNFSLLQQQEGK